MVIVDGLEDWQIAQLKDAIRRVPTIKCQSFYSPANGVWRNEKVEDVDINAIRDDSVKHIKGGLWLQSDLNVLKIEATMPHMNDELMIAIEDTIKKWG